MGQIGEKKSYNLWLKCKSWRERGINVTWGKITSNSFHKQTSNRNEKGEILKTLHQLKFLQQLLQALHCLYKTIDSHWKLNSSIHWSISAYSPTSKVKRSKNKEDES